MIRVLEFVKAIVKVCAAALGVVLVIGFALTLLNSALNRAHTPASIAIAVEPTLDARPTIEPTSAPVATVSPTVTEQPTMVVEPTIAPTVAIVDTLEAAVSHALGSSNRDVPKVTRAYQSMDVVIVEWTLDDTWSDGSFDRSARGDVAAILDAVQSTIANYSLINLSGSALLIDSFGNTSESPIVWLTFTRATMDKVNWSNRDYVDYLLQETVYEIADSTKFHPAYSDDE